MVAKIVDAIAWLFRAYAWVWGWLWLIFFATFFYDLATGHYDSDPRQQQAVSERPAAPVVEPPGLMRP